MGTFLVTIPNLAALTAAFAQYPSLSQPILQNAVAAGIAILAKYTTPATVPVRTSYLVQNWGINSISALSQGWYPKAAYASYVEFGTAPHQISVRYKKVLANAAGDIFGTTVNHPGTKANPYMERIMSAAEPEIAAIFATALGQINQAIASQAA